MARPTFFEPRGGLHPDIVRDALGMACSADSLPPAAEIAQWAPLELLVAYDWAMREHLSAAGNNVRRRPRPWFTVRRAP